MAATDSNPGLISPMMKLGIGVPVGLLSILAMMILPLPPVLLDVLFTFNIALSLVIVMAVFNVKRPLDFAIFPTVLLLVTLLRLALNVASTRVVLMHGQEGPHAAGKVIAAFGEFVIGGNYAVGAVVFIILTIINFVVVTKGAGRVSEVSARFALDAMPGKQMAIDADLNAGIITQDEARLRRAEVRAESDFYGSMDGASKFVRGDAVAGILIMVINIIGGLCIGTMMHGLPMAEATKTYTLLTIGDGLVAQIPGLMLSVAVAIIVTRVTREQDMGGELQKQLFGQPKALGVAALCGYAAWRLVKKREAAALTPVAQPEPPPPPPSPETQELSWEDVRPVDVIGLEVGYRLVPLVDRTKGGDLLARIRGIRRKLTQELGFLVQAVHIRDNLELGPNSYRIRLAGVAIGESLVHPDRELAINPGRVFGPLNGMTTRDPAFGMEAVWIEPSLREHEQSLGYTVVDAATVIATHLSHLIQMHAHELFGHEEAEQLMKTLSKASPKLVDELIPKVLPLATVVRVMQGLLAERVPIRNVRAIVEALAEAGPRTQDTQQLIAAVRVALGRQIVQDIVGLAEELPVITLEPDLERLLSNGLGNAGASPGLEPGLAERLQRGLQEAALRQERGGEPAVLLTPPALRTALARFFRVSVPGLHVLAWNEVPDNRKGSMVTAIGAR